MKTYLLNHPAVREILSGNAIVVVDGGARGRVFAPMDKLHPEVISLIRFEPDPNAVIHSTDREVIVPKALWNTEGEVKIHIAIKPAASSVFTFDRALQKHIDPFYQERKTSHEITVPCTSLDAYVQQQGLENVDFIKLDVHGSEYEVLEGARNALNTTLGMLIESWILPIHSGQKTRAAVELLALEKGFYLFEEYPRSQWARMPDRFSKRQPVAVDALYFKDPLIDMNLRGTVKAIKLIGMADLFGHYGFTWQLTEAFLAKRMIGREIYDVVINHLARYQGISISDRLRVKLLSYLSQRSCAFS